MIQQSWAIGVVWSCVDLSVWGCVDLSGAIWGCLCFFLARCMHCAVSKLELTATWITYSLCDRGLSLTSTALSYDARGYTVRAQCWYSAVVTVLSHVLHVVARCRDPAAECLTQSDETLRIGRRLGRAPGPLGSCPRICSGMRLAVNSCHSMLSAFHQLRAS